MTLKEIGWFIEKEMIAQDFKMIRFREIGINDGTVQNIINGGSYKMHTLFKIAEILDLEIGIVKMEERYDPKRYCRCDTRQAVGI